MSKGYSKPDGLLLSRPVDRTTPKSEYLLALEKRQRDAVLQRQCDDALRREREEAFRRQPFTVLQMRRKAK